MRSCGDCRTPAVLTGLHDETHETSNPLGKVTNQSSFVIAVESFRFSTVSRAPWATRKRVTQKLPSTGLLHLGLDGNGLHKSSALQDCNQKT